ncbi:MAG: hypothetical protein J7539_06940 [Niabella sp.]|nr:hypothetical protein [Niabella sp.]
MEKSIRFSLFEKLKGKNKYSFDQSNTVRLNDMVFAHSKTEVTFAVDSFNETQTHIDCAVDIIQNDEKKSVDILQEMKEYAKKLSEPFDTYSLRINQKGVVENVLNLQEIREKWEAMKMKLQEDNLFASLPEKEKNKFFILGETHLSNPREVLEDVAKSPLYGNVFNQIYEQDYTIENAHKYQTRQYPSGFFRDIQIPVDCYLTINELETSVYELVFDGALNNLTYPRKEIASAYKENYQKFGEPFMFYTFDVKARYLIDQTNNLFSGVKIYVNERVNNLLSFFSEINIKRMDDIN